MKKNFVNIPYWVFKEELLQKVYAKGFTHGFGKGRIHDLEWLQIVRMGSGKSRVPIAENRGGRILDIAKLKTGLEKEFIEITLSCPVCNFPVNVKGEQDENGKPTHLACLRKKKRGKT